MHCRQFLPPPANRREMLIQAAQGFGGLAVYSARVRFGSGLGQD